MSPAHDSDEEEIWQICDKCNSIAGTVTITPGEGRRCAPCRS
jgi:hypothetical protein